MPSTLFTSLLLPNSTISLILCITMTTSYFPSLSPPPPPQLLFSIDTTTSPYAFSFFCPNKTKGGVNVL